MTFTAAQIAMMIGGQVEGNNDAAVGSFGKIEEAQAGQLSFLANPKYEEFLYTTKASVVIVNESLELRQMVSTSIIRVPDAYSAFAALLEKYQQLQTQQLTGIEQPSHVDATAKLGENVFVGAFAYISKNVTVGNGVKIFPQVYLGENVIVGDGCILMPGVKVYHDCVLGKNVIVHSSSVIGSDGFGFAPQTDGSYKKIPQIGNVILEDDVEIGSNASIDRATMGSTIIKSGAKIDNLVQIAHNVEVGSNTVIAAQAGISGSTKVGANVMIGGQAGLIGHLAISDGAKIAAQSGVTKSLTAGKAVTGSPAFDNLLMLRAQAAMRRLPDLEKKVADMEKIIAELKEALVKV